MRAPFADHQLDPAYLRQQAEELRTIADDIDKNYPALADWCRGQGLDLDDLACQADQYLTIRAVRVANLRARATNLDNLADAKEVSAKKLASRHPGDPHTMTLGNAAAVTKVRDDRVVSTYQPASRARSSG